MAKKKAKKFRPIFSDISVAEVNLALEKLLNNQVKTVDLFEKERVVPIFFRERDSKIIPDSTPGGMIEISYDNTVRADSSYQNSCNILSPITHDENGNTIEYQQVRSPDAVWLMYTVSARSDNWNDIIKIQSILDKVFPVNHRHIDIKGTKMQLFREGLNKADDSELGIFIREYSIKILGYIFGLDCNDRVIVPAIRSAELEMVTSSDPNDVVKETFKLFDC